MSTHIGVVLDMSGSMGYATDDTKGSVISYVKEIKKGIEDGIFNLTIFDTVFEEWVKDKPLKDVKIESVMSEYRPRGNTALYDAIGHTVRRMKKAIDRFDKSIVVIVTDGYENSSTIDDRKSINKLVNKLQKSGNWTFIYLGANVDSWAEANKIGIPRGNTAWYSYGKGQFRSAEAVALGTINLSASPRSASPDFFRTDAKTGTDFREEVFDVDQVLLSSSDTPVKKRSVNKS